MSYGEIVAAIRGNQARIESEVRMQASLVHRLGQLIGYAVNQPKDYPAIHDTFPGLFNAPIQRQQNWEAMKARVEAYAVEHRKRGVVKNGDNT